MTTSRIGLMLCLCVTAVLAPSVSAQSQSTKEDAPPAPSGVVDASRIADVADTETLVEVSIEGPLLRAVAKAYAEEDPTLADCVNDLDAIHSMVLELPNDTLMRSVRQAARELQEALIEQGWQQLARIREQGISISAFTIVHEDQIVGLVIMSFEQDQFIYSNIAGRIDLEKLARLSKTLTIPGLGQALDESQDKRERESKKHKQSQDKTAPKEGN